MEKHMNIHQEIAGGKAEIGRVGIAADHGGFDLKQYLVSSLQAVDYKVVDFGAYSLAMEDDYPDFIVPLAQAVAGGEITRGIAICGSGVGACIAANKVPGVRAALITDSFSAHQGVEDDDMNVLCLGGRVTGQALSLDLTLSFLDARFKEDERFKRRLKKVEALENKKYDLLDIIY
jgi:ribose 5-phosphate isomerase B